VDSAWRLCRRCVTRPSRCSRPTACVAALWLPTTSFSWVRPPSVRSMRVRSAMPSVPIRASSSAGSLASCSWGRCWPSLPPAPSGACEHSLWLTHPLEAVLRRSVPPTGWTPERPEWTKTDVRVWPHERYLSRR